MKEINKKDVGADFISAPCTILNKSENEFCSLFLNIIKAIIIRRTEKTF